MTIFGIMILGTAIGCAVGSALMNHIDKWIERH